MTSFVHTEYPTTHQGVNRVEAAFAAAKSVAQGFDTNRGLATLLLAASVSALLVVANQVIEAWSDGHLLAAWVVLWAVAFAALGLLAVPARTAARSLREGFAAWRTERQAAAQDRKIWDLARQDARLMAEINAIMSRDAG